MHLFKCSIIFMFVAALTCLITGGTSCRVGSEKLKAYTRKSIERLLDEDRLESFYWPDEPLDAALLSKVIGVNLTLAETHFSLESETEPTSEPAHKTPILRELFVSCSVERDRSYTMTINVELTNPFMVIDLHYDIPSALSSKRSVSPQPDPQQASLGGDKPSKRTSLFKVRIPQSTFMARLSQRISYDECLTVNYVQLSPNVKYEVDCVDCSAEERDHLEKIFSKRMTQLDTELDSMLSDKLALGLQMLLNQERLDLDLYVN